MFAIAATDRDWFADLRDSPPRRRVNFWTPTPWHVKGLKQGDRLYFMLKKPIRKIGGFGSFTAYNDMTAKEAWETYGLGNGVASLDALVAKINAFAERRSKGYHATPDPLIGCIELTNVVTLDDDAFMIPEDVGHSFPRQVVKLKYFSEPDRLAVALGNSEHSGASALSTAAGPPVSKVSIGQSNALIVPAAMITAGSGNSGSGNYRKSQRAKEIGDWAEKVAARYIRERVAGCTDCVHRAAIDETPGWDIDYFDVDGVLQRVEVKGTIAAAFTSIDLTANEMNAATTHGSNYWLYLVAGCLS